MDKCGSMLICTKQAMVPHLLNSTRATISASKLQLRFVEEGLVHCPQRQGLSYHSKTGANTHVLSVCVDKLI